jgi:hypothetical protein
MKGATRMTTASYFMTALAASAILTACPSQFSHAPDARLLTSTQVLDAAQNYYVPGPDRPAIDTTVGNFPPGHSIPDDPTIVMTIATMTPRPGPIPDPIRILAQITSNRDYQPMGIRQGRNLVWRDMFGFAWITTQHGSVRLLADVPGWDFPESPSHEPSLYRVHTNSISFVVCLDDCGSGHCGKF